MLTLLENLLPDGQARVGAAVIRLIALALLVGSISSALVSLACWLGDVSPVGHEVIGALCGCQAGRVAFAWWVGREARRERLLKALKRYRRER